MILASKVLIASAGAVLVAIGYAAGHLTAPKCASIEADHSRDTTLLAQGKATGVTVQQVTQVAANDHQQVRTVVKYVKLKDGTEATTTTKVETHDQATTSTLAAARATWETETETRLAEIERDHLKQVAAARPDWSAIVIGGANVPDRDRFIGALVTRRILGPAELGVFASTRGDVGAALAVRW